MRKPFGFNGGSYTSQSRIADDQMCMNWYPEQDESGSSPSQLLLYPGPGLKAFATLLVQGPGDASFDQSLDGGSATNVTTFSVGPITPTQPNEWALFWTNHASGLTMNAPFTPFGAGGAPQFLYSAFYPSGNITASGTFGGGGSTYAGLLMTFLTNGAPPSIANTNDFLQGYVFTSLPRTIPSVWTSKNTPGNNILVLLQEGGPNGGVTSISDTDNNTYVKFADYTVAGRRLVGWIAENISGANVGGQNQVSLTDTLGFSTSGDIEFMELTPLGFPASGAIRGEISINGRSFAVCGPGFVELFSNGTYTQWGTVANDSLPVTMASSSSQVAIAAAGTLYVFNLNSNTLVMIPGNTFPGLVSEVAYCAGFFIATIQNSDAWFASAAGDGTTWPPLSTTSISVFPDNIVGMLVDHNNVWFWGGNKTQPYYLSGGFPFPFAPIPGGIIEQGLAARLSPVRLGNTVLWIGADERGQGVGWMAQGFTPTRISTHAVEFAWQGYVKKYGTISDAVALAYQDQGHQFWVIYFPSAGKTWAYDVVSGFWHERGFWNKAIGQYSAARYQCHTYNFGRHLVGDWNSPTVYEMSIPIFNAGSWQFADDFGNPIRRLRRSPHVNSSHLMMFFGSLEIYLETGLGPVPDLIDGNGNPRAPMVALRYSNDGGATWSNELEETAGKSGETLVRVLFNRLGSARSRTFELVCSDPIPWRVTDAYLDVEAGDGNG